MCNALCLNNVILSVSVLKSFRIRTKHDQTYHYVGVVGNYNGENVRCCFQCAESKNIEDNIDLNIVVVFLETGEGSKNATTWTGT